MKKFTTTIISIIFAFAFAIAFTSNITANAESDETAQLTDVVEVTETAESTEEASKVYDLNGDGNITIADGITASHLLEDKKLTDRDFLNICSLLINGESSVTIENEEINLDFLDTSKENIRKIKNSIKHLCIGYKFDGITISYRYIYDGTLTTISSSDIGISETAVAILLHENCQCVVGISPKNTFVIDADLGITTPYEFEPYQILTYDENSLTYEVNNVLYCKGMFENAAVFLGRNNTWVSGSFVVLWFNNQLTITEVRITNFDKVETPLRTVIGTSGEEITVGLTADGKIAAEFDLTNYNGH